MWLIKNLHARFDDDKNTFDLVQEHEIKFLLNDWVEFILETARHLDYKHQPLMWDSVIKHSPNFDPPIRYRARLDSASRQIKLLYSVQG